MAKLSSEEVRVEIGKHFRLKNMQAVGFMNLLTSASPHMTYKRRTRSHRY